MEIREIRPVDHAALVALWHGVFGDPEDYVETFLRYLPEMGGGVAAFEEGRPLGAAYMITALRLREGENSRRCGYLYAVAVKPEARGRGVGSARPETRRGADLHLAGRAGALRLVRARARRALRPVPLLPRAEKRARPRRPAPGSGGLRPKTGGAARRAAASEP